MCGTTVGPRRGWAGGGDGRHLCPPVAPIPHQAFWNGPTSMYDVIHHAWRGSMCARQVELGGKGVEEPRVNPRRGHQGERPS